MTDHDALVAAVLAHRSDDTPRMVYADYLDETGQSERARYVRLSVELSRTEKGHRHDYLSVECDNLLWRHGPDWVRDTAALFGLATPYVDYGFAGNRQAAWHWSRGFVHKVLVPGMNMTPAVLGGLCRLWPIEEFMSDRHPVLPPQGRRRDHWTWELMADAESQTTQTLFGHRYLRGELLPAFVYGRLHPDGPRAWPDVRSARRDLHRVMLAVGRDLAQVIS